MLVVGQGQIERNDLLPFAPQRLREQRMPGPDQADRTAVLDDRQRTVVGQRETRLGPDEIHRRQEIARLADTGQVGTDRIGKTGQDTHDLAALLVFERLQFVVELHDLDRFDIDRLAGRRLVVDQAFDFLFIGGGHRDHGAPFADRDRHVAVHDARSLRLSHDLLQAARHLALPVADRPAQREQFRGSVVPHLSELVDDRVDVVDDLRKTVDPAAQGPQLRILLVGTGIEKGDQPVDHRQPFAQRRQLADIQERALDGPFFQERVHIDKAAFGQSVVHHQHRSHLENLTETRDDRLVVVTERRLEKFIDCALRHAERLDLATDTIETDLILKIIGINQNFRKKINTVNGRAIRPGCAGRTPTR